MKIRNFKSILILMATTLALLYTSCTKNDLLNTTALKKSTDQALHSKSDKLDLANIKVSFKHDMLVFETMEDYLAMTKLVSTTNSFDKKLKSIFPSFKSIEDVYFEFIESDKFKNMSSVDEIYKYKDFLNIYKIGEETFIDPLMYFEKAKIFNSNGMIQIGHEIIMRKYDEMKSLKISEIKDINNLVIEFKNNSQVISKSIKVLTKSTEENFKGTLEPRFYSECAMYWCSDPSSNSCSSHKFRVIGRVYVELWGNTSGVTNVGAFTKSYKRGIFGIWASSSTDIKLQQSGMVRLNLYTEQGGGGGYSADYYYDISALSSFGETSTIERSYQPPSGYYLNNYSANINFEGRVKSSNGAENPIPCSIVWL